MKNGPIIGLAVALVVSVLVLYNLYPYYSMVVGLERFMDLRKIVF